MEPDSLDELFVDIPQKNLIQAIEIDRAPDCSADAACGSDESCAQITVLASELEQVRSTAFQAMMMSAELGTMLRFLQHGMESKDFQSLARALFDVLDSMKLKGSLHVFYDSTSHIYVDGGELRPVEAEIFKICREGQRIIDFGARTIFNHSNCSLLIRNMPLHDIDRYGMLRDNLCILLDVVQNRVNSLILEQKTASLNQLMDISLNVIQNILVEMDAHQREFTSSTSEVIDDMMLQLKADFSTLNLDQVQEERLVMNFEAGNEKLGLMFKNSEKANQMIRQVLEELVKSLSLPATDN